MAFHAIASTALLAVLALPSGAGSVNISNPLLENRSLSSPASSHLLAQATWQPLIPEGGGFEAEFPLPPTQSSVTTTTPVGDLEWRVFDLQKGDEFYAVGYTDLSDVALNTPSQTVLQGIGNQLITQFNWDALSDRGRPITLNGHPGREFIGIVDGEVTALRLYLVQQRLYGQFISSESVAQVARFFDAFQLQSQWQPIYSEPGGFVVQMPMLPTELTETTDIGNQTLQWNLFEAETFNNDSDLYIVGYTDLAAQPTDDDALLDEVSQFIRERLQAESFELSREGCLADYPSRAFLGQQNGNIIAVRLYLVDQRLYGVFARSAEISNIQQFLSSFEVL